MKNNIFKLLGILAAMPLFSASCSSNKAIFDTPPNYEHLIGEPFNRHIYANRNTLPVISSTSSHEVIEVKNSMNCVLAIRVRKNDDLIDSVEIISDPKNCYTPSKPLNWNR